MITIIVASFVASILYRLGGKEGYNTKYRDFGVPLVFLIALSILHPVKFPTFLLSYFLTFLLMFGSLTSYTYFLPKPKDKVWYHFALHGFFIGLSALPLMMIGLHWYWILLRTFVLSITVCFFSILFNDVDWEEGSRGFCTLATLPICLIG